VDLSRGQGSPSTRGARAPKRKYLSLLVEGDASDAHGDIAVPGQARAGPERERPLVPPVGEHSQNALVGAEQLGRGAGAAGGAFGALWQAGMRTARESRHHERFIGRSFHLGQQLQGLAQGAARLGGINIEIATLRKKRPSRNRARGPATSFVR
jgi:hypothetical protein